ncbi:hypothetical protein F4680DRAFT_441283 [Xylaria scruposa]|nr:hypothetical protein F4680DRAFT_441283 [Xylaria scruposa]
MMDNTQHVHSAPGEIPMTGPDSQHVAKGDTKQASELQLNRQSTSVVPNARSLSDYPGSSSSNLENRLREMQHILKTEKESRRTENISHENAMNSLAVRLNYVQRDLEMERNRHQKTKLDLIEKEKDAQSQRQLALDAVGELNRFLRGNKVHSQSTDDEIIQKAMTLRISIRDFAILHFERSVEEAEINQVSLESLNKVLQIPSDLLKSYTSTSSMRINLIRAFFWAYLYENVFNQFSWTWRGASAAFKDICGFLDGFVNGNQNENSQAKRKFHTWRANTTSLLVEAMSLDEATAYHDCQRRIRKWSNHISDLLEPLSLSRHQDYQQQLEDIISQSVELDKEICKQIANIEWVLPRELPCTFEPKTMELDHGLEQPRDHSVVTLVLGPGLIKHGKSSGDRFDLTERLLSTQVFCDRSLCEITEGRAVSESQDKRKRTSGIRAKFQEYRRWIEDANTSRK